MWSYRVNSITSGRSLSYNSIMSGRSLPLYCTPTLIHTFSVLCLVAVYHIIIYVCVYRYGHHIKYIIDQPGEVASPFHGQLNE